MRWRRTLDDEQRDELERGSNHFGEQAARAFLDGHLAVALASADRAIRDHEALLRDDPTDQEVVAVLADRLRDRAEFHRSAALGAAKEARGSEARSHARAGIADGERAIELYEATADDPDRFPLWVPSVRMLLAEMSAPAGRPAQARRHGDPAVAAYRGSDGGEDAALDLAHALMRYAYVLADLDPAMSLDLRRESVHLVRRHAGVGGRLWEHRHDAGTTWASTPTWRSFVDSAWDLAVDLGPPRPDVAREALLALQDAVEGLAAVVSTPLRGRPVRPGVEDEVNFLTTCVFAMEKWLGTVAGVRFGVSYPKTLVKVASEPDPDCYAAFAALREPLLRHLDEFESR